MRGPHHLVVTLPIPVEDIASPTPLAESDPAVVGLFPSGEEPAELQERIGCFAINSGRHRRIHGLTIVIGAGVAEVTIYPGSELTNVLYRRVAVGLAPAAAQCVSWSVGAARPSGICAPL
jgi:hypothetical protein